MASNEYNIVDINPKSSSISRSSSSSGTTNFSTTSTPNVDDDINRHSTDRSDKPEHSQHFDEIVGEKLLQKTFISGDPNGSPSTSRRDPVQSSLESSDLKMWIRSG